MKIDQLPLFLRRTFQKKASTQVVKPVAPTGESSVMQTLLTFQAFLAEKYAPKTAKMYMGDVRALSLYLRNKKVRDISSHDLQQWIGSLVSPAGKGIERKTVNRKVSAITTYYRKKVLHIGVVNALLCNMRYDADNALKDQGNWGELTALPQNSMECDQDHCQRVTALTQVPNKSRYSCLDVYAE